MSGSGKQVLLRILQELSTQQLNDDGLKSATDRLRAGLLLHGSTADETFEDVSRLHWASDRAEGEVWRQGIATTGGVFVADVLETMFEMPQLDEHLMKHHPALSPADCDAARHALWLVVSAVQMFTQLNAVETADIDVDRWVAQMMSKYDHHFRLPADD